VIPLDEASEIVRCIGTKNKWWFTEGWREGKELFNVFRFQNENVLKTCTTV
jgi:hypothetical protein